MGENKKNKGKKQHEGTPLRCLRALAKRYLDEPNSETTFKAAME
jgi:hypothetical protein